MDVVCGGFSKPMKKKGKTMAQAAEREARYEDLFDLPEHVVGEILDGELIVSPRPAPRHANASSVLGAHLNVSFHRRGGGGASLGGWWILFEPELHLGRDILVPDLAGWRRERLPRLPDDAFFTLSPDWVCEVLSPSTAKLDRVRKQRIYAREKVAYLWLVDPVARTLEIYQQSGDLWQVRGIHSDTEVVRAEPFEAIELVLSRWWADADDEEDDQTEVSEALESE